MLTSVNYFGAQTIIIPVLQVIQTCQSEHNFPSPSLINQPTVAKTGPPGPAASKEAKRLETGKTKRTLHVKSAFPSFANFR